MINNIILFIKNVLIILVLFIIANALTSVITMILARISYNIKVVDLKLVFDPLITVAYLAVYYVLNSIYQPRQESLNGLFVMTMIFSFSMIFFKGAVLMYVMYFLLRKTRLI